MGSGHGETINVTLKVWRQDGPGDAGRFEVYQQSISTDASFLEMLDQLNEQLNDAGAEPARTRRQPWRRRATTPRPTTMSTLAWPIESLGGLAAGR